MLLQNICKIIIMGNPLAYFIVKSLYKHRSAIADLQGVKASAILRYLGQIWNIGYVELTSSGMPNDVGNKRLSK